jgi:hypothetical protein
MLKNPAYIFFFVLIPLCAIAGPKERKTTTFQAVRVRTEIHGSSSSGKMFTYTNQVFAQINGRRLVYECAQRGDICPVLETGKTYSGDQDGSFLYLAASFPDGQKDLSVKFRQVGSW